MTRSRSWGLVLLTTAVALTGCTGEEGSLPEPGSTSTEAPPVDVAETGGYAELVDRVGPSVVTVLTDGGLGSGVVLREDVVVTNAHVVGEQREVTIAYADATRSAGEVLATDPVTDLAVIRTERTGLPVPEYREELPRPGEVAVAIGSPLGFENSVTAGIISGLHREIPGSATRTRSLVDLIQTDASISPGNSGGALLDSSGRVVGVNEAYIPPSAGAVSLGFAIPSATVVDVAEQLLADGEATHSYLGVSLGRLTPAIQEQLGVAVDHGALVLDIDRDGPAAEAGVRQGDVVVEFADQEIRSVEDLLAALRDTEPDQRTTAVVARGDTREDLTITIGAR
ncbi:S1C family serine protease [Actinophytocola gossypii]|uniref:Trypsin-like peptidase domain-containing protein n=1 Tax=Actinophytocola gossypii TaxID=2812003 RepID=A0ABT2J998_9PSEU|nr:trypsin-like peptidase domain-containing protein [Actinophytocola gossypii]MCT2584436.1 trypsin-like peptidase domain-containing protein [Actinophytocola gossypii]